MNDLFPKIMLSRSDGIIDLAWGHPSDNLHPLDALKPAIDAIFVNKEISALQYSGYQGYGPLIGSLSQYLSEDKSYTRIIKPEELYIGYGASHGLDLACTLFTGEGNTVLVEEPSYYLVRQILIDHRLNIVGVPTDSEGMKIENLEQIIDSYKGNVKLLYLIPSFHNPMGSVMSLERREKIIDLADKHDILIAADEAYHLLYYGDPPPPTMATLDDSRKGCVVSLGSFSKILAPGIKLGWIQANPDIVDKFTNSGSNFSGGNNNFAGAIVDIAIRKGILAKHVNHLKNTYKSRMEIMSSALKTRIPEAEFLMPQGGYYFWIKFPEEIDANVLEKLAFNQGVTLRPGVAFSGQNLFSNCIRLCFALSDIEDITEGINRLGQAYDKYISG
ncbi:MAG: PLP-dependent aminotransferase family protein [SAR202 cluster bacterium]|nr:PLP-dependent aminotransferase family protein [SAR202 cluster bacterium]|tara:strand:+ start:930 stop:2093 length:1164 start_codon:yes stop_codon:yes gene_type:complete